MWRKRIILPTEEAHYPMVIWKKALLVVLLGMVAAYPPPVSGEMRKILYVNSYHAGYLPSDGMEKGALAVLEPSGHTVKIVRMDTKRHATEAFKVTAGHRVKDLIDAFRPDVVITTDDNALKYLFLPFFANSDLPFVFSGVNWSLAQYGGPYSNLTGMLEVALIDQILVQLEPFARGMRIGYLSGDIYSERQTADLAQTYFGIKFHKTYFVSSFAEWRQTWKRAQEEVDILIFENNFGIAGWQDKRAVEVILAETRIPVGATNKSLAEFALICISRDYEEQGAYPARVALDILSGRRVADIPIVRNEKAKIILNMKIAKALKVRFPVALIENATLISAE